MAEKTPSPDIAAQPGDPAREARASRATATQAPPPEVIVSTQKRVMCDGGGGALGHPVVWYDMGDDDFVECGYCDRRFVLKGSKEDPGFAG